MPQGQTLAQMVRAKYPGAYDDLSDTALEAKVKAKFPGVYDDLPTTKADTRQVDLKTGPAAPTSGRGTGYSDANRAANTDMMVNALPVVGGAVGGLIGAETGPGAIGTAAAGASIGESAKQLLNRWRGSPDAPQSGTEAAAGIAGQATLGAIGEGVGQGVAAVGKVAAPWLMKNAVRPVVAKTSAGVAQADAIVQTLLKDGITVSKAGLDKLQSLFTATNNEIKQALQASKATIDPGKVAARTGETAQRAAMQVNPKADVAAVAKSRAEFEGSPLASTTRQVGITKEPIIGANGQPMVDAQGRKLFRDVPVMGPAPRPIPVQTAHDLKVGTYRQLEGKYGEEGTAAVEAQKALARGLKEEIAAGVPEIASLNAREGELLTATNAVARRVASQGPHLGVTVAATHPLLFLSSLIDKSPAIKSMLARGLYQSAAVAGGTTKAAIRTALLALAEADDGKEKK